MLALIFDGPGRQSLQERPKPTLRSDADAIVRIARPTISGTDLHILRGDVATCRPGTTLGHEGVDVVDSVGSGVTTADTKALKVIFEA